jgi:Cd2+/Zn2+-exporting ATPase
LTCCHFSFALIAQLHRPGWLAGGSDQTDGEHRQGATSEAALEESLLPEEAATMKRRKSEKTYLDMLGVCCSPEVALVERLLAPLDGVRAVSVIVPS